jgi:hypothetical protein
MIAATEVWKAIRHALSVLRLHVVVHRHVRRRPRGTRHVQAVVLDDRRLPEHGHVLVGDVPHLRDVGSVHFPWLWVYPGFNAMKDRVRSNSVWSSIIRDQAARSFSVV